jgi:hypothetical protein
MSIIRKSAYVTAAIIGAAALTATQPSSAWANSWDYGSGYGSTITQAHGAAMRDLWGSYGGCTNITLVSDTYQGNYGNTSWYAVVKGFCGAPR